MRIRALSNDESGAILVISALSIVVLMVFAALTVDLGAAWAERRQLQSAADAGAMAAVLPPLNVGDEIADIAMDFVDTNVGINVDRFGCAGWTPSDEGVPGTFKLVNPGITNCVWISTATPNGLGTLIAVKVPTQQVPTAFARVIGINSIPVDAFAVSQIATTSETNVLPFVLLSNPGPNECLGSPPGGISRNPCTGGASGNFGYLSSPSYEFTSPPDSYCTNGDSILDRNIAIGGDHPVQEDVKWPADNTGADDDFPDECAGSGGNSAPPTDIPDSVWTRTGVPVNELHDGLVSDEQFGPLNTPSRLQQLSGPGSDPDSVADTRTIKNFNVPDFILDNVGLWEYVASGTGACDPGNAENAAWNVGGPAATNRMEACLQGVEDDGDTVTFDDSLWDSPRFAVIPELWSSTFPSGGSGSKAIKQFRGLYLQGTWFNCSAAGGGGGGGPPDPCLVFTDINDDPQDIFFPGEGDDTDGIACEPQGQNCKDSRLQGLSSFVLPIASIPDDVISGLSANVRLLYR